MTRDEMQAQIDLLRQENDRLRRSLSVLVEDFLFGDHVGVREEKATLREENDQLRAAIDRVRALHERETRTPRFGSIVWHLCPHCRDDDGYLLEHPCPTLRALDGDA
jgi:hypothetical protein